MLTDQEKAAFYEEITRYRTLDYFYVFDNVPLHSRLRLQLPVQKCSTNLSVAREADELVAEAVPDRETRLCMTFAKGSQVVAEGIVSWTENGTLEEAPFISFLLLDADGLIIRERRHIDMSHWPGADRMIARLGLRGATW